VATTTDPLGHSTSYVHDAAGLLRSKTDARNVTLGYAYDLAGRLVSIAGPDGSITTTYDSAGRRTAMTDMVGTTNYGYDTAGRLASVATRFATVSYTYDDAGNRASMTAGGKTTSYTYDPTNLLSSVSRLDIGTFGFTYNADGQPLTLTRPNGVTSTTAYDGVGRPASLTYKNASGTTLAAYAYTYDASGNRTSATDSAGTESYSFDTVGRLIGVSYPDGTSIAFGYDAAGNRTSLTSGSTTTSYTYDDASELTSAGSTHYTYDPAGNRTSAGSASFTYDDFGYLASATSGAATIAYQTNGDGLRVSATADGKTATYTWDEASALPELLSDGTTGYLSGSATVLAETSASSTSYPLADALGSVRSLTDGSGSVSSSVSYDVFGSVRNSSGSIGSLGYTGALSDASGLTYLQARSLDSSTGTLTSRDPMTPGAPGITGFNLYAYAGQNPSPTGTPADASPAGTR
jgi:RHS repeat-associated protein